MLSPVKGLTHCWVFQLTFFFISITGKFSSIFNNSIEKIVITLDISHVYAIAKKTNTFLPSFSSPDFRFLFLTSSQRFTIQLVFEFFSIFFLLLLCFLFIFRQWFSQSDVLTWIEVDLLQKHTPKTYNLIFFSATFSFSFSSFFGFPPKIVNLFHTNICWHCLKHA